VVQRLGREAVPAAFSWCRGICTLWGLQLAQYVLNLHPYRMAAGRLLVPDLW